MRLNIDRITDFTFCWQKDLFCIGIIYYLKVKGRYNVMLIYSVFMSRDYSFYCI